MREAILVILFLLLLLSIVVFVSYYQPRLFFSAPEENTVRDRLAYPEFLWLLFQLVLSLFLSSSFIHRIR